MQLKTVSCRWTPPNQYLTALDSDYHTDCPAGYKWKCSAKIHKNKPAAFEHHMKFDGTGYPDTHRHGKRQHIVSQLVAIADFFDAMRTERPYRKTVDLQAIVLLLKETAGKDFNPLLINNFLKALNGIGAFGEITFE